MAIRDTGDGSETPEDPADLLLLLDHGVEELLRREWDFAEAYDSGDPADS